MITEAQFNAFCEAQDETREAARGAFESFWDKTIDSADGQDYEQALYDAIEGILGEYGKQAAQLSADFFESQYYDAYHEPYHAVLADPIPPEQIKQEVRFGIGYIKAGDMQRAREYLSGRVDVYVHTLNGDTIIKNAETCNGE
jgi:hypothetical protein